MILLYNTIINSVRFREVLENRFRERFKIEEEKMNLLDLFKWMSAFFFVSFYIFGDHVLEEEKKLFSFNIKLGGHLPQTICSSNCSSTYNEMTMMIWLRDHPHLHAS